VTGAVSDARPGAGPDSAGPGSARLDSAGLRALQKPLKDAYRADPDSARVPARAVAVLDPDSLAVTVAPTAGQPGPTLAGPHPAAGGDGAAACSADMLCQALAACTGVTLSSVATAMGVRLRDARVVVDGTWDARGTLGVSRDVPVGLGEVTVTLSFSADNAEPATLDRLVELTERYCVIAQTLTTPPRLTVRRGPP